MKHTAYYPWILMAGKPKRKMSSRGIFCLSNYWHNYIMSGHSNFENGTSCCSHKNVMCLSEDEGNPYSLVCFYLYLFYNTFNKMPLQEDNFILSLQCSEVLYVSQLEEYLLVFSNSWGEILGSWQMLC